MLSELILYINDGTYNLKPTSNDRFFEKLFNDNLISSRRFSQKSTERQSPNNYFFIFRLYWRGLTWRWNHGLVLYIYYIPCGNRRNKDYFHISFCSRCLSWVLNQRLESNKSIYYLLDYGDCNQ